MSSRFRGWCFTINNYSSSDIDLLLDLHFEYLIFGFEVGKKKTPHIQGYLYFHDAKTFETVKKKLPKKSHIERQKGTPEQAAIYCMKDGEFYVFGELPCKGRAKFEQIKEVMEDPEKNFQIYHQYRKTYKEYLRSKDDFREKKLFFVPYENRFAVCSDDVFMDPDIETYDSETVCILNPYTNFNVENWYAGYPPRIRRGYEVIKVNPHTIYLTYDSVKELNYLKKKYVSIDYRCLLTGEDAQLVHEEDCVPDLLAQLENIESGICEQE